MKALRLVESQRNIQHGPNESRKDIKVNPVKDHYHTILHETQSNIPNSVSTEVFCGYCHAGKEGIASQIAGVRSLKPWRYARVTVTKRGKQ